MPTTNVENTNGAIIICTSLKKMVVNKFISTEKKAINEVDEFSCTMYPSRLPASIAMRT